jgi:uncharacterized protein (TIGR03086 family)
MSQNLRNYVTAIYGFDAVIRRVPDDRWSSPSPCEGWSARDVVLHQIGVFDGVAAMARSGELARPVTPDDVDDLVAAWTTSRDGLLESLDQPDVLRRSGSYWFGASTIDDLLGIVVYDPLAHTWDVATAVGVDHHCSPEVAAAALVTIGELAPMLRDYGLIGEPTPETDDADTVSRFLALVGRDPAR